MGESKSEDWLPPGWTMKERVRDNGKKDKVYNAPSNGPAFNSRSEGSRYLDAKAKKKNLGTLKPYANAVLLEKGNAEGLPPGWIKEVRVRKRAGSIRRDPFYYEPVSKNVFRSLKAVNRYLKTEEPGTLAQNSEGSSHKDSEDDCTFSTGLIKKQQLGVNKTRRQIDFSQCSDMNEIVQEEQEHNSSSQPSPLSKHASDLHKVPTPFPTEGGTELRNSDIQEAEGLDQKGEKADAYKHKFDEVLPAKQYRESEKARPDQRKSKKKMVAGLPRRVSKRLAGLDVDPIQELKPRTRARRVAVEESSNGVAGTSEDSSPASSAQYAFQQPTQVETDSNRSNNFSDNLVTSEKQVGKAETVIDLDEKQRSIVFPLESQIPPYDKADEKLEAPLDLPLGELLTDPCIAFAIKTLTGVSFYKSESSEVLPGSISSEQSSADLAMDIFGKVETESRINGEQDCRSAVSLEEHARTTENDTKADEKSGSPIEFPFGVSWQDPCIEFAIKTLTDAIPLDYDPNIQQYFQQQLSSSRAQGSDEMSFTSVGLDNLFQTDSSCQPFCDVEKPQFQQEFQAPHSGTDSLRNSDGSFLNQSGKERQ